MPKTNTGLVGKVNKSPILCNDFFLVAKVCHFAKRKRSDQHGQGNFLKKIPKKSLGHLEEESGFLVDLGSFRALILLKILYLPNRF